jgi:UDP-N-acetylglucosamine 2-epimerase (non-hydrolysing)
MLDQVLALFDIRPDHDLSVMQEAQDLFGLTARIMTGMRDVLRAERPDIVLVHGDTTTALAASLACYYEKIPVGHVEAGLRTGNIYSPWPEEMNRAIAGRIAALHFAPTPTAAAALAREGVPKDVVHVTGNTVIDALLHARSLVKAGTANAKRLSEKFDFIESGKPMLLVTAHRRESFDGGLSRIADAMIALASQEQVSIVYPVHPNPIVKANAEARLGGIANIHLIEPQDYLSFVYLMESSSVILTDSGGIQEEAPSLGKPVLVLRDVTERPEAIAAGTVRLVGTDPAVISSEVARLLHDPVYYNAFAQAHNPYGDGMAAARISRALEDYLFAPT